MRPDRDNDGAHVAGALSLPDRPTVPEAWLEAAEALCRNGARAYNLVYSVRRPSELTPGGRRMISAFDAFARTTALHSTATVANTIFPLDTYLSQGASRFYDFYLQAVFPKVRKQWGTYFERMIRRWNDDGSVMTMGGAPLNPLARLIEKARRRVMSGGTTTHYELPLHDDALEIATYDARQDGAYQLGGPCMSHLSFKVDDRGALRLTAFYRSHWYVGRALGNLIGLARLQAFVAAQAGASVGPLTIVASEAVLDLSAKGRSAAETRRMLSDCRAAWEAG